eukprot:TRINITY_DN12876_c0_g1_i1.p1 TRINITY_DN12876_c0_g1~~TRINITY_DN12876_c0_g1_i1.p1  ORF type:complete len:215 (+),score=55.88 TRINITY_DN12876_c0_g1_i1:23-667(+)
MSEEEQQEQERFSWEHVIQRTALTSAAATGIGLLIATASRKPAPMKYAAGIGANWVYLSGSYWSLKKVTESVDDEMTSLASTVISASAVSLVFSHLYGQKRNAIPITIALTTAAVAVEVGFDYWYEWQRNQIYQRMLDASKDDSEVDEIKEKYASARRDQKYLLFGGFDQLDDSKKGEGREDDDEGGISVPKWFPVRRVDEGEGKEMEKGNGKQ